MAGKPGKAVTIRRGDTQRMVSLTPEDFRTLRGVVDRPTEIRMIEKQYGKLRRVGLVRHEFTNEEWPRAIAHLTQEGEQALSQEFS